MFFAYCVVFLVVAALWLRKPSATYAPKKREPTATVDKFVPMPGGRVEHDNDGDRRFVIDETNTLPGNDGLG